MQQPLALVGYPPWLPSPLQEPYLQAVLVELTKRESLRARCRSWNSAYGTSVLEPPQYLLEAYSTDAGREPINRAYNRYNDVLPYDSFRVRLGNGEYLNASWVRELNGGKWTIATQAPIEKSVHAFLSLFMQPLVPPQGSSATPSPSNRLRSIVQLTPNVEGRSTKAFQYFPKIIGEEMIWSPATGCTTPPIRVKLLQVSTPEGEAGKPSWIHSVLELSYQGDEASKHLVRHLHYLARLVSLPSLSWVDSEQGWPDHSIPNDIRSLLQFMKFAEACNIDASHADAALNPDPPMVIGCSAGVGRTGTYIALSSILRAHGLNQAQNIHNYGGSLLENTAASHAEAPTANWKGESLQESPLGPLPPTIAQDKIAQEVDWLRDQRPMMVQTAQQLRFIYQVFLAAIALQENAKNQSATWLHCIRGAWWSNHPGLLLLHRVLPVWSRLDNL